MMTANCKAHCCGINKSTLFSNVYSTLPYSHHICTAKLAGYLISAKSYRPRHQTVSASLTMQVYLGKISRYGRKQSLVLAETSCGIKSR